jgi:DNA-binding response OmpR family regulator
MPTNTFPKTILIVDDDADLVRALETALHAEFPDYDIDTAENGNKAVEKWEATRHRIVLLDMMLPGRSGFLVLEKMRRPRQPPQRPAEKSIIIMITGNQGPRHRDYALSLQADEYLVKPLKYPRLCQVIKNKLAERATQAH